MGKSRNKKNAKQNAASKPMQSVNICLSETMSAAEMQHIIAGAILEADKIKAQNEEEEHKIVLSKWQNIIGYKEHKNILKNALNKIKVFFKIMFLPKKYIEGDLASSILLKAVISFFFWFMKWCSLLLAVFLTVYMPMQCFLDKQSQFLWSMYANCIAFAFLAFIFSRLFRMAGIEIDKLDDRNYLFGLFASITSLVSIIIAVIAIIKGD